MSAPARDSLFRTPRALALAGLFLACAGCGPRARVTVVNDSRDTLTSLRVAAEADSVRVPALAPGESALVSAPMHVEDALVLRGRLGGRPLAPGMPTWVEDGARVRMAVDSTGWVTARAAH